MASAAVRSRVRQIAPEFAVLTDTQIDAWADYVAPYLSTDVYPLTRFVVGTWTYYDEATALFVAHLLTRMPTTEGGGGGGGSAILITSDSTGDLSQSYGMPAGLRLSASDMDLTTTHYGLQLMRLRGSRAAFAVPTPV
jgi:hypothetical protein